MTTLLEVDALEKRYRLRGGGVLQAVAGTSFSIAAGEVLALVGESGCGKSTIGRCVLGLEPSDGGAIRFEGARIDRLRPRAFRPLRRRIQMVFQDPYGSLDPRMRVAEILAEPLVSLGLARSGREAMPRVLSCSTWSRCLGPRPSGGRTNSRVASASASASPARSRCGPI